MKDEGTGWVEADVTINGVKLTFAESLTLRVAISTFHMSLTSDKGRRALGPVGNGYLRHLENIGAYIFKTKP